MYREKVHIEYLSVSYITLLPYSLHAEEFFINSLKADVYDWAENNLFE